MNLAKELLETRVSAGEIAVCWTGQAGFILKDNSRRTLAIDLYLTDCGERYKGFKRIAPKLLSPMEVAPDYYLITHTHFDHLDYDAIPIIASAGRTMFIGPFSVAEKLREMMIPEERIMCMDYGDTVLMDGIRVTSVYADHNHMVPESFGYIVDMGGHRLYFSGDTCYREDIFEKVSQMEPDIFIGCTNGMFGNMSAEEAAKAAILVRAKAAIPCHFWMFMEHHGSPWEFADYLKKNSDTCRPFIFRQGEIRSFAVAADSQMERMVSVEKVIAI